MSQFIIYADTQALCKKNPKKRATTINEEQTPCSFGSLLVDRANGKSLYESSRGPKCIETFFEYIRTKATELFNAKQKIRKLIISDKKRQQLLTNSRNCVVCHNCLMKTKLFITIIRQDTFSEWHLIHAT